LDFNGIRLFSDFLDSQESKWKTEFFQVEDFGAKKFKSQFYAPFPSEARRVAASGSCAVDRLLMRGCGCATSPSVSDQIAPAFNAATPRARTDPVHFALANRGRRWRRRRRGDFRPPPASCCR
jgi:hypothetical protein